jgi:hypothetical protein
VLLRQRIFPPGLAGLLLALCVHFDHVWRSEISRSASESGGEPTGSASTVTSANTPAATGTDLCAVPVRRRSVEHVLPSTESRFIQVRIYHKTQYFFDGSIETARQRNCAQADNVGESPQFQLWGICRFLVGLWIDSDACTVHDCHC